MNFYSIRLAALQNGIKCIVEAITNVSLACCIYDAVRKVEKVV